MLTARPPERLFHLVFESPWWKGLGAESEEKREPVSDIDTGVVVSLKVLDPDGRLEKRTNERLPRYVRLVPLADIAYRQCGPQRGDRRATVPPLRRAAIGVSAQRPRSLPCGSHRAPRQASTAWAHGST